MRGKNLLSAMALACAMSVSTAAGASAQYELNTNRETYFTFSQPVALPNVTLAPGKYMFRVMDSKVMRNVIQVFNEDGTKVIATLITVPTERRQVSNDPEVRFYETAADVPLAIQSWWFRSERTGWEFIYPRQQAMTLARRSTAPILTTAAEQPSGASTEQINESMRSGDLVRVNAEGQQAAYGPNNNQAQPAPAAATERAAASAPARPAPTASPRTSAASTPEPAGDIATNTARAPRAQDAGARRALPATATNTPLLLLMGIAVLSAGVLLQLRGRSRLE